MAVALGVAGLDIRELMQLLCPQRYEEAAVTRYIANFIQIEILQIENRIITKGTPRQQLHRHQQLHRGSKRISA